MIFYLLMFCLAFVAALGLTPLIRHFSFFSGALDKPDERKLHPQATPRLGGWAVFLAGLMGFAVDTLLWPATPDLPFPTGLFAGSLIIVSLGTIDDWIGLRPVVKLLVELGVAGMVFAMGFRIEQLAFPGCAPLTLGIFSFPLTLLWVAGIINGFNLIDGMDGLAAGTGLIAAITIFGVGWTAQLVLPLTLAALLAGSLLGFLIFNFPPASIFLGDCGSLLIGFVLSVISIQVSAQGNAPTTHALLPVLLFALPILDTLLAIIRRLWTKRPLFQADRQHVFHLLLHRLSHRRALALLYSLTAGTCIIAALVSRLAPPLTYALFGMTALVLLGGSWLLHKNTAVPSSAAGGN